MEQIFSLDFLTEAYAFYFKQNNYNYSSLCLLKYNISDLLISCSFNDVPCELNDFTSVHHLRNGHCWLFNGRSNDGGDGKTTYWAGIDVEKKKSKLFSF